MAAAVGFYGKIPARGDFVRAGLPASFVTPWDAWLQQMIAAAIDALAARWQPVWLEAPVWRFALPAGQCGPAPVLGLWMPSIDAAGRYFPLTLAAVPADAAWPGADAWLDAAEQAGRDALEADLSPADLGARLLAGPDATAGADAGGAHDAGPAGGSAAAARWWTEGGPHVASTAFTLAALPDTDGFRAMLLDPAIAAADPA